MSSIEPNDRSPALGVLPPSDTQTAASRRLLEAAVVAFAERGYHGVSIRDLTSDLGMTVGSVYSHFPSKEALLFELIRFGHEAHQTAVRDGVLGAGADPAKQLYDGVYANVAFQATYPMVTIVANNEMHALTPEHQVQIATLRRDTGTLLIAAMERGHREGVFDCPDPWLAMSAIGAMGIRVASWFRPQWLADMEPTNRYPGEVATWLPEEAYTVESIADTYAKFALKLLRP
jgi:AcrR family transcriptional regulator